MRLSLLFIFCLSFLGTLVGCNADPRSRRETALLRSEIMDLEDQYYSVKSRLEQVTKDLAECKGEPVESFDVFSDRPLPSAGNVYSEPYYSEPYYSEPHYEYNEVITESPRSNSILNAPRTAPNEFRTAPTRELPDGEVPGGDPLGQQSPIRSEQDYDPDGLNELEISFGKRDAEPGSPITEIFINPELTAAQNVDSREGDDGLALLIQPRTATGQTVMLSGLVTISLIDPAASPEEKRVGLWKFTEGEMDLFAIQDNSQRKGYMLHLPWDINVPRNKKLLVSVRFVTADGRRLETSKEIRIRPPVGDYSPDDPLIAEWTERIPFETAIADDTPRRNDSEPLRRGVRAIPAKTRINRPEWRPVR